MKEPEHEKWNSFLISNILAPAYAHLIEQVAGRVEPRCLFALWPDPNECKDIWKQLVQPFLCSVLESQDAIFCRSLPLHCPEDVKQAWSAISGRKLLIDDRMDPLDAKKRVDSRADVKIAVADDA